MFIIDRIDCESAWQALLLHTELPPVVVEVEEDVVVDVGVWVEDDDEVPLHVSLL